VERGEITIGQHFSWKPVGSIQMAERAIVTGVRSDRQEGLAPEVEEYAAFWIEARSVGRSSQKPFTIMVGTDGKNYVDGSEVSIYQEAP